MNPSAGNTFMDTTVYNTNQLGDNTVRLLPGRQGIKHQYKFTITATALGGITLTSPEWTMDVVCGPQSVVLSVLTSLGTTQTVFLGEYAYFTVDSISNTFSNCPLTSLMLEDTPGSGIPSPLFQDSSAPSAIAGTTYRFLKANTSIAETTQVHLRMTFQVGGVLLKSYTLITSCSLQTLLWNPNSEEYGTSLPLVVSYGEPKSNITLTFDAFI